MLASARVQQLHARHAAQPCTAHKHLPTALGHRGPENTFPQPLTPNTNSMVPSCIVLTSLDAKMRQLQPLLAEAQARHIARVYVTTPDTEHLVITQHMIDWLTELYGATGAVSPRLDVVPCLACAGWTPDRLAELQGPQLLLASSSLTQPAQQLQQQLNSHRAADQAILVQTVQKQPTQPSAGDTQQQQQQQVQQQPELLYQHVAVGGTFDRFHAGHRLLLAATALVSSGSIYIGITSDALLAKKSNKQLLQDYNTRQSAAVDFMVLVRPAATVTAGALTDPAEPTQAELDPDMEALVVSQETLPGGEAINQGRIQRGFKPLNLVVVGLIGGSDAGSKLSSTALRAVDAGTEGQGAATAAAAVGQ